MGENKGAFRLSQGLGSQREDATEEGRTQLASQTWRRNFRKGKTGEDNLLQVSGRLGGRQDARLKGFLLFQEKVKEDLTSEMNLCVND